MHKPSSWDSKALSALPERELIVRTILAALEAVDPEKAVAGFCRRAGPKLVIDQLTYDLDDYDHLYIIGVGKASLGMARGVVRLLDGAISAGVVVTKNLPSEAPDLPETITVCQGGHPVPTEASRDAADRVLALAREATERDLVLCVISGGGSALLCSPAEGITLGDLQQLTSLLLASGATIHEMNVLRKHLDRVKGGGLLKAAARAQMITLILSDVVGNNLESIASGPTVPDPSSFSDALAILRKYHLESAAPQGIVHLLRKGAEGSIPETLKPGDFLEKRVQNILVGSNELAAQAALETASQAGLNTYLLTTQLQGEAREVGQDLARIAWQAALTGEPVSRPACLIAGGETTVSLHGQGKGGRNQEVALGAVERLADLERACLVTLATDGEDGPTRAAGAIVTGKTLWEARQRGLDPAAYLAANDSNTFFARLDALIEPGPTGTNVNDLNFIFLF